MFKFTSVAIDIFFDSLQSLCKTHFHGDPDLEHQIKSLALLSFSNMSKSDSLLFCAEMPNTKFLSMMILSIPQLLLKWVTSKHVSGAWVLRGPKVISTPTNNKPELAFCGNGFINPFRLNSGVVQILITTWRESIAHRTVS